MGFVDWDGRAGCHRRTGENHSAPNQFLLQRRLVYHFKGQVKDSQRDYRSVNWFPIVGFILQLKPQGFSLISYN